MKPPTTNERRRVEGVPAAGPSAEEIVASYPLLGVDDVRAATAYAAGLARESIVEIGRRGVA